MTQHTRSCKREVTQTDIQLCLSHMGKTHCGDGQRVAQRSVEHYHGHRLSFIILHWVFIILADQVLSDIGQSEGRGRRGERSAADLLPP